MNVERRARICALNDRLRRHHINGRILLSHGVVAKGTDFIRAALRDIALVDSFDEDNDPYGEHDFGSVEVGGERLFWKIDYYDQMLRGHAVDPADGDKCVRVMTVMLAYEY